MVTAEDTWLSGTRSATCCCQVDRQMYWMRFVFALHNLCFNSTAVMHSWLNSNHILHFTNIMHEFWQNFTWEGKFSHGYYLEILPGTSMPFTVHTVIWHEWDWYHTEYFLKYFAYFRKFKVNADIKRYFVYVSFKFK